LGTGCAFTALHATQAAGKIKPMPDPPSTRPKISRAWLLIVVVLAVLILGDLNRRMADARRLERDRIQLQTEVASIEAHNNDLRTKVAEATNDVLVEEWARSQAGMVREGEHLILPLGDSGATPVPVPETDSSQPNASNWSIWWALLFGR
jgi:cell division protein FtsB